MSRWDELFKSERQHWQTPPWLLEQLYSAFPFELDVCALVPNVRAGRFFSPKDDGLSQGWHGLCWCNPPYSEVGRWIEKAREESEGGATVLCLTYARTDTRWWQDNVPSASVVTFIRGRLKFVGGKHSATAPSALILFGECTNNQWRTLSKLGWTIVV